MKQGKFIVFSFVALALAAVALFGIARFGSGGGSTQSGRALIGGPFSLVDSKGKAVTDKTFRGKYLLVYFGYTHCPEICPMSLQAISDAMADLGPLADQITPLFITVDPDRDTPQQLADYVSNFDPRTVGLTGTPEQVKAAAKAYRVYSQKTVDGDLIDFNHSAITFLMDRNGDYVTHFAYGVTGDKMAKKIRGIFEKREPKLIAASEKGN